MADIRDEILNIELEKWVNEKGVSSIYPKNFPEAYKQAAINAMDENGKRLCLELLEYMAKNNVRIAFNSDNQPIFRYKENWISKEQLFENFL